MPFAVAADLFLAGATLGAERAHALGLIGTIVAPDQLENEAVALAARVAELSPLSVRANRRALRALRDCKVTLFAEERARLGISRPSPRSRATRATTAARAYGPGEARDWAREHLRGVINVIIPRSPPTCARSASS